MALTKNFRRTGAGAVNELREQQWQNQALAAIARGRFLQALNDLKAADPHGWEAWYDDDANVPEELDFSDTRQIERVIAKICMRVQELTNDHTSSLPENS